MKTVGTPLLNVEPFNLARALVMRFRHSKLAPAPLLSISK